MLLLARQAEGEFERCTLPSDWLDLALGRERSKAFLRATPPELAISRSRSGLMAANPRFFFSSDILPPGENQGKGEG
jgi:hypothetical protein